MDRGENANRKPTMSDYDGLCVLSFPHLLVKPLYLVSHLTLQDFQIFIVLVVVMDTTGGEEDSSDPPKL